MNIRPETKPKNINFSSGPTAKRPGWSISTLESSSIGRSHRSSECKDKLKLVIDKSKNILGLPSDYLLGMLLSVSPIVGGGVASFAYAILARGAYLGNIDNEISDCQGGGVESHGEGACSHG